MNKPGDANMYLIFVLALVLSAFSGFADAASVTVKTDRNPVALQESFQLIFEAEGKVDDDPDFSPLEKDFEILFTSVSSNMSIINSKITSAKQWQLTLLARKTGQLIIPAVSFGKDKSPPSLITVEKTATSGVGQTQQDIFVDVEATPQVAHVQSEIIYTMKLYRSIATSNETLSGPELSQGKAVIEQLDADKSYETSIKGRRFLVFERSYAIYPQVSGILSFTPIRYQAQASANSSFVLDPFGPKPKSIIRQSEPVQLEVKPIPAAYGAGHWLPAKSVQVTEEWSTDPFALLSAEPVTRTVTITAKGLTASQLPELPEQLPASFRQYPDKPVLTDQKTGSGIIGVRQQKNAIIPTRAGEYTLAEITLPWWNTETMTLEQAVLPERKVKILAAVPEASADLLDLPSSPTDIAEDVTGPAIMDDGTAATGENTVSPTATVWQWLTLILAATWVFTIIYILKNRKGHKPEGAGPETGNVDEAIKAIKRACQDGNPQRAKAALLKWAQDNWPGASISSLGDLENLSCEKLADEIRKLSRQLYSRDASAWQGEPLWQAFLHERKTVKAETGKVPGNLEPLFRL